ncbi:MAG TPA: hypothetical protein VF263_13255 [Longimicrobiaceae bacterium]
MITQLKKIRREIAGLWRRLLQGGSARRVRYEALGVLAESARHRSTVQAYKGVVEAEYAQTRETWTGEPLEGRPQAFHYHATAARIISAGAWALLTFEALFTAWLMPIVTTLPDPVAIAAGVVIAILLAYGAKGAAMIPVGRQAETPVAARDVLVRWVVLFGVVEILLLAVLFFVRSASGELAVRLAWTFGPASGLISLTTPILSGLLAAMAELFGWSTRLVKAWDAADELETELALIEAAASRRLEDGDPPSDVPARTRPRRPPLLGPGGAGAATAAIVVLLVLSTVRTGSAQGTVYVDWTTSTVVSERDDALREVARLAPEVSRTHRLNDWRVIPFTDDVFTAMPRQVIRWPSSAPQRCIISGQSEAGDMLAAVRSEHQKQAQRTCADQQRQAGERQQRAEALALRELRSALSAPPARQGRCSSVIDLLQRLSATPPGGVGIGISDGLESCGSSTTPVPPPRTGAKTVLVLITANTLQGQGGADAFRLRREAIRRVAPWLNVVPVWGLGQSLVQPGRR